MNDRDEGREWIKKHKERDYHQIKRQKSIKRERQRIDWKRHIYKEIWANQERHKNMEKDKQLKEIKIEKHNEE